MRKLILRNFQSPGDILMLTAAIRDLHKQYPGQFLTDVRTPCPELWQNNPFITPLSELDPRVEQIDCSYPLINSSNSAPYHFIFGFIDFLNKALQLQIQPTEFRADLHISGEEKNWISQIHEITGTDTPFWIIVAGGKNDFTIKWWSTGRYQDLVDHFRNKICFVQVGESSHYHPPLKHVIDLRGKTDLRQLVRLMYHADGVVTPVSLCMHLSAATPLKSDQSYSRPCVVIAGGREPVQWEAYPGHQFIHTIGALRCCADGGCWRSRTLPIGDGDEKDLPENCCLDVAGDLPRCMDMISAAEVIRRVEWYYKAGRLQYNDHKSFLTKKELEYD